MTKSQCQKVFNRLRRRFPGLVVCRGHPKPGPIGYELFFDLPETLVAWGHEPTENMQRELAVLLDEELPDLNCVTVIQE